MKAIKVKRETAKNAVQEDALGSGTESVFDNQDDRIAISAYFKSEARGYEPGHEIQDWLEAEAELKAEKGQKK